MTKFYTADLHLHHKNIIKYSNRPFDDVEKMNEALIKGINERAGEDDELYIIGDVSFGNIEKTLPLLERIKCKNRVLVWGNHDSEEIKALRGYDAHPYWREVTPYLEVNDSGSKVVLCHYKFDVFNRSHHGALQLYGHSHGSLPGNSQQVDVGVDCWDYRPITLGEAKQRMKTLKPYRNTDHNKSQDHVRG